METQEQEIGVGGLSTAEEIEAFFNSRIPTLEQGMPIHAVLGHVALYITALETKLVDGDLEK